MEVREISKEQTYPIRQAVLRPGRPPEELKFPGDDVPGVFHLGIFAKNRLLGIATLFPEELPGQDPKNTWRLRGMAVLPGWQGKGVGRQLLTECLAQVAEKGGALLWCNARQSAVPFYKKSNFLVISEGFEFPGIGLHFRMLHQIQNK